MPSPFPGMDPYLEDPGVWSTVHPAIISVLWTDLNALLPEPYVANMGERLYVVQSRRDIWPDVSVKKESPARRRSRGKQLPRRVRAVQADPPLVLTLEPTEIRRRFIEIRVADAESRIVTVIEVLSPFNKALGSPGREQYRAKQREVLDSGIHLLEIDLLRRGAHTVAAPLDALGAGAEWDYLVSLKRGGQDHYEVWPFTLRQRLPRIRIPLASGDPDQALDLQAVLDRCYDNGNYGRQIDYRRDPAVRLSEVDAAWADALLRRKRLRPPRPKPPKKGKTP